MLIRRLKIPCLLSVVSLGGVAVLAQSCGGSDKAAPPPPGHYGEFQLSRYRTTLPGAGTQTFLYADARFLTTNGGMYLEAGNRIVFEGPGGEIPLVRLDVFGRVFYQKDPDGPDIDEALFVNGADYAMRVNGGSSDQAIRGFNLDPVFTIPAAFQVTAPDFSSGEVVVDGTAALNLAWVAGDGDYVDVILAITSGGTGSTRTFRTPDDGGLVISTNDVAALRVGTGSLTLVRTITTAHTLPFEGTGVGIGADAVACRLTRQ